MAQGQKFIKRNRPPRVHIQYDTELFEAERKPELPFVMGVMSDLAGKSKKDQKPLSERAFVDVDAETLDKRMEAMAPRVEFEVPNELTDEGGQLTVDLTFTSMKDFSPGKIAENAEGLKELYKARTQLENLLTNVSGKPEAKLKILEELKDPAKLQALVSGRASAKSIPESDD